MLHQKCSGAATALTDARSPGIFYLKEDPEARLEEDELPSLHSHPNYSTAEASMEDTRRTYEEECLPGMTLGPFRTRKEAAEVAQCGEHALITGALGSKDEGDK